MPDLMELIDACPTDKTRDDFSDEKVVTDLRALGFKAATKERFKDLQRRKKHERIAMYNYRVVTNEAIGKFLDRKVEIYNREHGNDQGAEIANSDIFSINWNAPFALQLFNMLQQERLSRGKEAKVFFEISRNTVHRSKFSGIGQYQWTEVLIEDYPRLPPRHVLDEFKKHKERNLFDQFTIASVNEIPDPILFGRIKEDKERRWFIAQWGSDVCLDDLI